MEFKQATKYSLLKSIEFINGGIASRQLIKKGSGNVTLFSFDKGEGLSEHTAPFDAFLHVIEGEAEISIAHDKYSLVKDEVIILPADIPHAVFATKKFKMILVMIKV
jgi:quercetin dioxygenase-like cupin family protein